MYKQQFSLDNLVELKENEEKEQNNDDYKNAFPNKDGDVNNEE